MSAHACHLGLPMWGLKDWTGSLYTRGAATRDFLGQYARVFDTVEGNTTFYSVPTADTVLRWRDAVPPSFRFCFKLPQEITHGLGLRDAHGAAADFLRRLEPLGERLGPFLIQLPAAFGPSRLGVLDRFLAQLPRAHRYAVELRHPGFFSGGRPQQRADAVLAAAGVDRVIMDTRALRAGNPDHPDVLAAVHKKPNLPVLDSVTAGRPFLRYIGHPDAEVNTPWLEAWADRIAAWQEAGHQPYVFVHAPDNRHAPDLARRLHAALTERGALDSMPAWPGEQEQPPPRQLRLL